MSISFDVIDPVSYATIGHVVLSDDQQTILYSDTSKIANYTDLAQYYRTWNPNFIAPISDRPVSISTSSDPEVTKLLGNHYSISQIPQGQNLPYGSGWMVFQIIYFKPGAVFKGGDVYNDYADWEEQILYKKFTNEIWWTGGGDPPVEVLTIIVHEGLASPNLNPVNRKKWALVAWNTDPGNVTPDAPNIGTQIITSIDKTLQNPGGATLGDFAATAGFFTLPVAIGATANLAATSVVAPVDAAVTPATEVPAFTPEVAPLTVVENPFVIPGLDANAAAATVPISEVTAPSFVTESVQAVETGVISTGEAVGASAVKAAEVVGTVELAKNVGPFGREVLSDVTGIPVQNVTAARDSQVPIAAASGSTGPDFLESILNFIESIVAGIFRLLEPTRG